MQKLAQQRLAEQNKMDGEAFMAQNATIDGVVPLNSGLQYKIIKAGDGPKPTLDDTVVCHYRGTLVNGAEFDSSYQRNEPSTFALDKVIKGWSEGLQLMPVGSRWKLFIPSNLAYGDRSVGHTVGPNATLIFEVELLGIQPPQGAQRMQEKPKSSETAAAKEDQKAAGM